MKLHEKTIYWHKSVCSHPPGPALKSPPDHCPGRLSLIIKIRKEPDSDNIVKVPVLRWQPREDFNANAGKTSPNPNQTKAYIEEMTGGAGEREWAEIIGDGPDKFDMNLDVRSNVSSGSACRQLDIEAQSDAGYSDITDQGSQISESELDEIKLNLNSPHSPNQTATNETLPQSLNQSMATSTDNQPANAGAQARNSSELKFLTHSLFSENCTFFQTDLDQVRSIRAHFNRGGSHNHMTNDEENKKIFANWDSSVDPNNPDSEKPYDPRVDCGQMILASLDSQYKTFHFHNGGLQIIVRLLLKWSKAAKNSIDKLPVPIYAHPALNDRICHPLQGQYQKPLSELQWRHSLDPEGRISNPNMIKEHIFFQGCTPKLRCEIYPFLLDMWSWNSTFKQREALLEAKTFQ